MLNALMLNAKRKIYKARMTINYHVSAMLRGWLKRKLIEAKEEKMLIDREIERFRIGLERKYVVLPVIKDITQVDVKYPLIYPFAYARIRWEEESKELVYEVIEPSLTEEEKKMYDLIEEGLTRAIDIDLYEFKDPRKLLEYLKNKTLEIIRELNLDIKPGQFTKLLYFIYRNFVGLDRIEPIMHDSYIEDIGCDGVNIPIYVTHKKYGNLKSNIIYTKQKELQEFVIKLAERCGRYISYAEPLLDGSLPDGSRVQATLASDVTTRGPTFSIRKFREIPYSPTDLMRLGTASSDVLAYLWFAVEHNKNILIAGGTATGKTTILNAIISFIPPEAKVVSIEDTRELNLFHENWIPAVARTGFGVAGKEGRYGEVTMFDLLKESFRQNPDFVIVGEVRGVEASVLFQGMASGHTSLGTVHGGSVDDIIKRMQTPPIELPPSLLETLDIIIVMQKAHQFGKSARRIKEIAELESIDPTTGKARVNRVFTWSPMFDRYDRHRSYVLEVISAEFGIPASQIEREIEDRKRFLEWMYSNKIFNFHEVGKLISLYYKDKKKAMELVGQHEEHKDVQREERNIEEVGKTEPQEVGT